MLDIAVLKVDTDTSPHWIVPTATPAHSGQQVYTVGFPAVQMLGQEPKVSTGIVNALSGIGGEEALMQVSAPISTGSSGGPVFTEKGKLTGIMLSTAEAKPFFEATGHLPQNVNWAIKAGYLEPLVPTGKPETFPSVDDAKTFAEQAVYMVKAIESSE